MSNQTVRNSQGSNTYSPSKAEKDTLTLVPNVILTAPNQSFGWITRSFSPGGSGIYMNALNGTAVPITGGVSQYTPLQSQATIPYYAITANDAIRLGSTLIYSKIDNVLAINCTIPIKVIGTADFNNRAVYMHLDVCTAAGDIVTQYSSEEYDAGLATEVSPPVAATKCQVRSLNAVVRVPAGHYAILILAIDNGADANPSPVRYQDKVIGYGTAYIADRCAIDIQRL